MTLKIYYDEIDGDLQPKWVLLPNKVEDCKKTLLFSMEGPFERFLQEDFHDGLKVLSVSQGALTKFPHDAHQFYLNIDQLKNDLCRQGIDTNSIFQADYFVLLVDDLEELLSMEVKNYLFNLC